MNTASFLGGAEWLAWIAALALKASIVLLLAATAAALLWRASAAARHLAWFTGLMGVLSLPLFSAALPAWDLPLLPAPAAVSPAITPEAAAATSVDRAAAPRSTEFVLPLPATAREWLPGAAVALAAFGVAAGVVWLSVGFWGVSRIGRRAQVVRDTGWLRAAHDAAEQMGLRRPVLLLRSRAPVMPATWGLLWPSVVLPSVAEQWTDDRRSAVLAHELAHVKRFDCLTQALAQVTCALFWWHPGVWYAARRLRVERERACDDLVLGAGARPSDYAAHLLEIARMHKNLRLAAPALVSVARPSHLESRLLWVLDAARVRTPPSGRATLLTLVFAVAIVASLAAMRPVYGEGPRPLASAVADPASPGRGLPANPAPVPEPGPARGTHPDIELSVASVGQAPARQSEPIVARDTLPLADLLALRSVDVNAAYVAEMRSAGYSGLTVRQLVEIKGTGVTGRYAVAMNAAGYGRLTPRELRAAKAVGMTPAYVDEIRAHGIPRISLRDAIRMKSVGVSGEYIAEVTGALGSLDAAAVIRLKSVGITADYIWEVAEAGLGPATADQLIRSREDNGQ